MAIVVVVGGVAFEVPQASATRGPNVISYSKTSSREPAMYRRARRHVHIEITAFQPKLGAEVAFTERIEVGRISFTAEMKGRRSTGRDHPAERQS